VSRDALLPSLDQVDPALMSRDNWIRVGLETNDGTVDPRSGARAGLNTRIQIVRERGFNVNALPRESY